MFFPLFSVSESLSSLKFVNYHNISANLEKFKNKKQKTFPEKDGERGDKIDVVFVVNT